LKIDIINRALIRLGEDTITSTQNHNSGALFDIVYEDARKSLLSLYVWRFAIKRQELAMVDDKGAGLYKYRYQRPHDCLTIVSVSDYYKTPDLRNYKYSTGERYQIEGNYILSNEKSVNLIYVADIEEEFPHLFEMALASKVAAGLTTKIHQNPSMYQMYEQEANSYLMQAIHMNEIMQDSQELGDNSWISVKRVWENE
jgi:hypothetical protein